VIELMQVVQTALPPLFLKTCLDNRHGTNCPKVWVSELNGHEIKCACRCHSQKKWNGQEEKEETAAGGSSTPPH
jgi:hypothetical protein